VLRNADAVIRTLNQLKGQGISHSLDDFGTGYSSLSYLQRLPISRIKIDRSFITHITSDPHDAAIVRAVVGMAHSLGIKVIAEGVETEGQLGYLRGLRCEEIQGYFFSRPLPAEDFVALLRTERRLEPVSETGGSERVLLLVDDEPGVLASLRRLLRPTEIEVLTSSTLDEAFEVLATRRVGVIVCDQRMPAMTGTEFLRRVRKIYPNVIRIVLSGYTELNSVIDAVNRGAIYKFLTKPWDDQVLLDSLRDAFRMYEMNRENRELSQRIEELMANVRSPFEPPMTSI
jgi:FixJ family two-component response regulator